MADRQISSFKSGTGGRRARRGLGLRGRLILLDGAAFALAASAAGLLAASDYDGLAAPARIVLAVGLGLAFARWQGLYKAGRSAIRSAEFSSVLRTSVLVGAADVVVGRFLTDNSEIGRAVLLAVLSTLMLSVGRSLFRSWLRWARADGRYARPLVVVGANEDTARIVSVLGDHPEAGFRIVGVCGDLDAARSVGLGAHWRGDARMAGRLVADGEVTGAIVVATALDTDEVNGVVRDIIDGGGHVHLSSGLHGIASDRIVSEPIAREPLLHIHPRRLDDRQQLLKRSLDLTLSSLLLVLALPVLAVSYVAIRLQDGGPALFRQVRVGRNGREFECLKLRTMVVDAEARMRDLADDNERSGPLFKLGSDPRVTRVGRFLRATSLDELPQLWNVLRGEMSLVGPRPALPSEVEEFPPDLHVRNDVLPGITGIWQVEARDNPSFDAYRRLDRFYVENWTVTLDLAILFATLETEVARIVARLLRRPDPVGGGDNVGVRPLGDLDITPAAAVEHNSTLVD